MSRRPRSVSSRPGPAAPAVATLIVAASWSLVAAACGGGSSPGPGDGRSGGDPVVVSRLDGRELDHPRPAPAEAGDAPGPAAGDEPAAAVRTGAQVLVHGGLAELRGLRVGLIANRASLVGTERTIDVLHRDPGVDLVALFAPEHGLAADGGAGTSVDDEIDPATGLAVHSLYGPDRAPTPDSLADLDVLVFDLQDVGARFYTYTATMGLAMQAAARAGVAFVVLDRPDPLGGDRADGPVRDGRQVSFVGLYPIPAVHGLTAGELALAIRGEGWLDGLEDLDLRVIQLEGWDRGDAWEDTGLAWAPPSPGLPTAETALLYPATVLIEATTVSYGRGTDHPFAQVGAPWLDAEAVVERLEGAGLAGVRFEAVRFTPEALPGAAGEPAGGEEGSGAGATVRYAGQAIPGVRLHVVDREAIRPMAVAVHLVDQVLIEAGDRVVIDQPDFFDRLAGRASLRRDLLAGRDPAAIVDSWAGDLTAWEELVAPYRLYGATS